MVGDIVDWILRVAVALGLPAIVLYYLKEKRKNAAESEVAERTVDSSVAQVDLTAVAQQLATMREALTMERESKNNLVADLRAQLGEARDTIATLRGQVTAQQATIDELTRRLDAVELRQKEFE